MRGHRTPMYEMDIRHVKEIDDGIGKIVLIPGGLVESSSAWRIALLFTFSSLMPFKAAALHPIT